MLLTDNFKNGILDGTTSIADIDLASLHTDYPGTTGANEVAGGSPAYAQQAITWNAASGGSKDNDANPVFDVPASTTVYWLGLWDGATYRGCMPLGGGALKGFQGEDSTDVLTADNHGFTDGQTVVLWGDALPTGLAEGTVYFVRDATTDTLKLAATSGGAAIDLTTDGQGQIQRIVPEAFNSQGTFTVTDVDVDLSAIT